LLDPIPALLHLPTINFVEVDVPEHVSEFEYNVVVTVSLTAEIATASSKRLTRVNSTRILLFICSKFCVVAV